MIFLNESEIVKIQPFYSQKWCKIGDKCHWNWFLMLEVSKILEIKIVLLFQFQDKVIYRKCCTLKPFKTIFLIKITVLGSWRMNLNNVTSSSSAVLSTDVSQNDEIKPRGWRPSIVTVPWLPSRPAEVWSRYGKFKVSREQVTFCRMDE